MQNERCRLWRSVAHALMPMRMAIIAGALAATPAGAATRGLTITSFDSIRVEAPVTVIVTTGTGASARAEGDGATLDRLQVDVSGRLLSITMDRVRPGEKGGGPATVRLSTGDLRRVVLTGGGSISVSRMKGLRGDIVLGGNGDISVAAVDLDQIDVALAGGGKVLLAGRTGVASLRVTGPGMVAAQGLGARQASIRNEGPGSVTLTADVTATIQSSGSGDVTVTGKAACTADNRGTGRILCGGESY